MTARVTVLGAGFAGMELSTILSETLADEVQVTLIDQSDAFVFGYSKLDVMFGRTTLDAVRLPYRHFAKPGVRLLRETVQAIDPASRRVTTDAGSHDCDYLVVALGADYDIAATPGLADVNEFYSVAGANRLREILPSFSKGRALIGVCGAPYKCPPAPSECALMLHDLLSTRGVREQCDITFVLPLPSPVPPSPETSKALLAAFAERGITFMPNRRVAAVDAARRIASLDDGSELPYELFLGVPKHRAPAVVEASGMTEGGWVTVNPRTLETPFPNVFAVGDIANTGTPKAGVFAEGEAKAAAAAIISRIRAGGEGQGEGRLYDGKGTCYIEFGGGRIGRVDVDFFSGPKPTGTYHEPDVALREDKLRFESSRIARWFGR
ncbi:NAD(P)/FAD-dependent oxidoreductase [Aquabacterium sp.]|uniref:NAD(P)/FAD-dependent oxidoreductase n=1 Tax=Aquabacterium sp. TaxID=1872578 RepID=UPI002D10FE9B|nr:FAD-dependent oxidoreductase [Aquabacterium sp.]HSW09231.1 FAD-dependent oxidoreductase [Aquabacterium sp.]